MGVVSGISNLGASAIQAGSAAATTAATNKANKEIAQMNNTFNEKMLDKQIAYNKEAYQTQVDDQWKFYNDAKQNTWDMWNATNEYNSASAQRERLEAAGLNPYMMMSGGNAGTAGASSSPSASAGSMQGINPPTATPYSADYSGITAGLGAAIDSYYQSRSIDSQISKTNEESNMLRIEGKYKAAQIIQDLNESLSRTRNNDAKTATENLLRNIRRDLEQNAVDNSAQDLFNKRIQAKLMANQYVESSTRLNFLDQQLKNELSLQLADLAVKQSQNMLTRKQVDHEIEKIAETTAKTSLINQQSFTENAKWRLTEKQGVAQQQENEFNADTYKNRVQTIREELFNLVHDTDKIGFFKSVSRFFDAVGIPSSVGR